MCLVQLEIDEENGGEVGKVEPRKHPLGQRNVSTMISQVVQARVDVHKPCWVAGDMKAYTSFSSRTCTASL